MASSGKRSQLKAWLDRERPELITRERAAALRSELEPISENYFRKLLRESGTPLVPLVEGVRQESFELLESSLLALLAEYQEGDREARSLARKLVISAKDHAKWSNKPEKPEMILWMMTWLENPPLFPTWLALRKNVGRDPEDSSEEVFT